MVETAGSDLKHVQFIGLGPAGTGVIVAADRLGLLATLLDRGVAAIDYQPAGAGSLGEPRIGSNSPCSDYFEGLGRGGELEVVRNAPAAVRLLEGYSPGASAPLTEVGAYLQVLGHRTTNIIEDHPQGVIRSGKVSGLRVNNGVFTSFDREGAPIASSKNVVQATGAEEIVDPRFGPYLDKVILSRPILTEKASNEVLSILSATVSPYVVIDGASHSGFSAALKLIELLEDDPALHIDILARQDIAVFFNTPDEAQAAGYQFANGDVCSRTGRINRFSGLRGDAKQLFLDITSGRNQRVQILPHSGSFDEGTIFDRADLIVQATGYKPRLIPVYDSRDQLVDPRSGVKPIIKGGTIYDRRGRPIRGLFAIGHGFSGQATRHMGGGKNEKRPVDGVNIYQGPAGEKIVRALLSQR